VGDKSKIEWTDATWNPVTGCVEVSPGCDRCYAKTFAERWRGVPGHPYENGFDVTLRPERLAQPLKWRRPRLVFVNSMSDLFHEAIPDDYIARAFAVMSVTPRHTYQVLTKRHGRMRALMRSSAFEDRVATAGARLWTDALRRPLDEWRQRAESTAFWPVPNVWLGVSVEDQKWADVRIPALKETPAAVRFLSCEPLLGPVERLYLGESAMAGVCVDIDGAWWHPPGSCPHCSPGLDWVIVGGESGHGARPMDPSWALGIRDACAAAGVPFLFKQWGGRTSKAGGRELDGRTYDGYPAGVR
jgi:protein gp37